MATGLCGTVGETRFKVPTKTIRTKEMKAVRGESYVDLDDNKNGDIILPGTSGSSNKFNLEQTGRRALQRGVFSNAAAASVGHVTTSVRQQQL